MIEKKLFVGNVPVTATASHLRDAFGKYCVVKHVALPQKHGQQGGFAFVTLGSDEDEAQACKPRREFH